MFRRHIQLTAVTATTPTARCKSRRAERTVRAADEKAGTAGVIQFVVL